MIIRTAISGTTLLALMLTGGAAAADEKSVMEKLAALEGDWMFLDENGEETDMIGSTFRLTAAGSALVEVMAPGSPDGVEMVNMYHADGDRVLMTHYCAAGNQPRMEVKATDDENRVELQFESVTNLASPDANHMHRAEYVFHGDDRLTTRWWSMQDGKVSEENHVTIELKRKK
ncbi:MAG: hypothetical protein OXI11_12890 [Gammaproteobacteria bacterium]|nr:hypothetical protein [Gammaproteobacteria bacterium]MXW45587.1 hypothetical protein [Gammaproteobacteria bacterium]MYD02951.1 hypothetical protein [Gammaproteobacteria bacterium]MYI25574.1 hypothetical protein [Gammaproteobacteria bacterium]